MSCYYPLSGWLSAERNESGKRSVVFDMSRGLVDRKLEIPCGKCVGCRADQALMWSIRAYHESLDHVKNSFITLTYDDAHLPPDGKLDKGHLQAFMRSLRRSGKKVRYLACGEYGETTKRPHYHAIVFGEDWRSDAISINQELWTSQSLADTWRKGNVVIADVSMASICYVAGYCHKKIGDPDTFNLASRRPGIGHNWLKRFKDDLRRTGTVTIEGREYPVPPRYMVWEEEYLAEVKDQRRKIAATGDRFEKRAALRSRERNRKSQLSQKKGTQ